jgi:hypothetical protein
MELEDAVDTALKFMKEKANYSFLKLRNVVYDRKEQYWAVTFDVGGLLPIIKTVYVRDSDGKIVGYE